MKPSARTSSGSIGELLEQRGVEHAAALVAVECARRRYVGTSSVSQPTTTLRGSSASQSRVEEVREPDDRA